MKRAIAALGLAVVLTLVLASRGQSAADDDNVAKFMRAKLVHSQKLLEALALEDFNAMAKNSQDLSLLSRATSWQVLQTPEYQRHSEDFRKAADSMTEAAKKKNLDGALLSYVELTIKCVKCHKYVRAVRMADAGELPDFAELSAPLAQASEKLLDHEQ